MKMMSWKKISAKKHFTMRVVITLICLLGCELAGWLSLKAVSKNVFYITPKTPYDSECFFEAEEIKKLQELSPESEITYECETIKEVQANHQKVRAKTVWVNDVYPKMKHVKLQQGRFLIRNTSTINEAVISRKLAFDLFKSPNVLGENIVFVGEKWEIVGVFSQESSGKKATNMLYVSGEIGKLKGDTKIPFLYIHIKDKTSLEARRQIEQLIASAGKDAKTIQVVDLYSYAAEIRDKSKVILFCIALSSLWQIVRAAKAFFEFCRKVFKKEMQQYYLWEYVGINKKAILLFIGTISFMLMVVLVSLKVINEFIISLPPDTSNFLEALVVKVTLIHELGSKALLPESLYTLWFLNKVGTVLCLVGCVSGISIRCTEKYT